MKFISNIDKKKYEEFVKNHKTKSHFLQSYQWGEFVLNSKNLIPHYVGLVDDNNILVACALLLQKKLPLKYSYFYAPRGFVLDYNNKEILKTFTKEIKEYLKKYKAIFLKIDPDVIFQNLSTKCDNNIELIDYLKSIGYKHQGFNKNFEKNQPRYTFRLNLNKNIDEIVNNFHPTTKKIIKKGNPYDFTCIKNDEKYIKEFYFTMQETAKRENIIINSLDYYLNFYKQLHKYNMSDLYVVQANIKKIKELYNTNIKQITKQMNAVTSENKKQEFQNQLNKLIKEKEELDTVDEEVLTLSSIIVVKYGNKAWTIHGGNCNKLRFLNANYYIYFKIIEDMNKENYELIDFFGTTGNPVPENPVYGIYLFKNRLGGDYLEFIGEFDYVYKKVMYFMFIKLIPIYRKIVKKIRRNKNES